MLPPAAFARHDESPDDVFYSFPRKVVHIDDDAIAALGRLYAEVLPRGGRLLDVMNARTSGSALLFWAGHAIARCLSGAKRRDHRSSRFSRCVHTRC